MYRTVVFFLGFWLAVAPYGATAQTKAKQPGFHPAVVCILPKAVDETSGLVFWRNSLWTHNDSGGHPVIYRLDTLSGKVLQRITLKNATNRDWEDIAQDKKYIYVGDIGNNSGNRHDLCIYKIKKSDIPERGDAEVSAEKIAYAYPDYRGPVKSRKHNNFDCEALLASGDSLYLFSKDWQDQHSRLYALPKKAGKYTARLVSEYNVKGLITGADEQPQTGMVVLLGYNRGNWVPFVVALSRYRGGDFFSGTKKRLRLKKAKATQTEGVAFGGGNRIYLSSEGRPPVFKQTLYVFPLDSLFTER